MALLLEVALGEGATGAGLEVAFEGGGFVYVREPEGSAEAPRTIARGRGEVAGVVAAEAVVDR
jgi:hypothetical protein